MERINYPNPQKIREETFLLNGAWDFSYNGKDWQNIKVPFCPESELSGIGNTDFISRCYYKRNFLVDIKKGDVILCFGAVDYLCRVYVNGKYVGQHRGGYTSFSFVVTPFVVDGENELYIEVFDEELTAQARGKQSYKKQSFGCFYTRVTGIWQDVWLEYTPKVGIKNFYFYPHVEKGSVSVQLEVCDIGKYEIEISYNGKLVGHKKGTIEYKKTVEIPLAELHLWEVGKGKLYDVKLSYNQDVVYTYFGMREVGYQGYDFLINGKRVYQKLVLDQGYCPDGICTSPSVEAMQKDIQMGLDLGFNGARLHQKVFQPQFLYLCDKMGYMVWGEFASWGVDYSNMDGCGEFLSQWTEAVTRDFNHPAIITWCPLNEAWGEWADDRKKRDVRFIDAVYFHTKLLDSTRPCVDVSGGHHGHKTDLFDFHCYYEIEKVESVIKDLEERDVLDVPMLYAKGERLFYKKKTPVNFSECGGFTFGIQATTGAAECGGDMGIQNEDSWGYGVGEATADGFIRRYDELIKCIAASKKISGFCYTQLYDIEQEQNGFYNYDRSDKLTEEQKEQIRRINNRLQ